MTMLTDAERASSSTATPMEIEAAIQAIENPGDCQSGTIAHAASTLVQVARRFLRDEARQFRERLTEPAPVSPSPAPDTAALLAEAAERLRSFVRRQGITCPILSTADECQCPFCDIDLLAAALRASEAERERESNCPICGGAGIVETGGLIPNSDYPRMGDCPCGDGSLASAYAFMSRENQRLQQRLAAFEAIAVDIRAHLSKWDKQRIYMDSVEAMLLLQQTVKAALAPAADAGDLTCKKVPHDQKGGYLHAASDDSPFHVDGVMYCGRCHSAWPCNSSRPTAKP